MRHVKRPDRVDIDAFAIALRNLIENAVIHGSADSPVTVTVGEDRTVAVRNGGPTIAQDDSSN